MTDEKAIEVVYPVFMCWARDIKGYKTDDSSLLIKLWYEFLSLVKRGRCKSKYLKSLANSAENAAEENSAQLQKS